MSRAQRRPARIRLCAAGMILALSGLAAAPAPVRLTAEQDHARLLAVLHIASIRPGVDGIDPKAPNAANYDEAKVAPYRLPDPLRFDGGAPVRTPRDWWARRRPQIAEAFDREVYGRVPASAPQVRWRELDRTRETVGGIEAVTRRLIGHADNAADPAIEVDIQMTLTTPAAAQASVPVMLELGFPQGFGGPPRAFPRDPAEASLPDWGAQVLARGWGYAVISPGSIQADNGAGLTEGVIGLANRRRPRGPQDWGALRAWAWGASRAMDYFAGDPAVDPKRVGIEGLSRYGKAALVAMAYDPRFAIGFIGSSGEGGAKLHRRNVGEQVENLAASGEYHWMAGNFLKYAGPLTARDLPVDAHELIALCAPRPVFISAGAPEHDAWVDARGMFLAAAAAGPVYRLLGAKDLGTEVFPPIGTPLVSGDLAFRQHSGGHSTGPNWPTFLAFA
ncbi:MAG TPA: acetylxylan esterase, partial [Phenylobacterium sp.]